MANSTDVGMWAGGLAVTGVCAYGALRVKSTPGKVILAILALSGIPSAVSGPAGAMRRRVKAETRRAQAQADVRVTAGGLVHGFEGDAPALAGLGVGHFRPAVGAAF